MRREVTLLKRLSHSFNQLYQSTCGPEIGSGGRGKSNTRMQREKECSNADGRWMLRELKEGRIAYLSMLFDLLFGLEGRLLIQDMHAITELSHGKDD